MCVCAQELFDVLAISQTKYGEIACPNGLHEAQECRSTDEYLAAAYTQVSVCENEITLHTYAHMFVSYRELSEVFACSSQSDAFSCVSVWARGNCCLTGI